RVPLPAAKIMAFMKASPQPDLIVTI
ncbi:MAG: hypothetical protein RLZZ535_2764, partial [Cyanobacteriota bacterium]